MEYSSGTKCDHCGKLRLARCCPHCRYYEITSGEMTVCQRCGGVFKHNHCFQCAWAGEPVSKAERPKQGDKRSVLGMFELEKMAQRLARKAALLGLAARAGGPIDDAVDHAFVEAHEGSAQTQNWTGYFESVAVGYLERLAKDQA